MKTICIPEDLHKELINLKLDNGERNVAKILRKIMIEYKKKRLNQAGEMFRKSLDEKGITFDEFLESTKEIKEEVADEIPSKNSN